jgi:hypothetical protein
MPVGSLIEKLGRVGAIERQAGEPCFTPEFAGHIIWSVGRSKLMEMSVGNWLDVLRGFHASLGSLTPDEVADTVLLFDYFLSNPESPMVT